jgi:ABC-type polysaccharide/polyol phosphate transport system ATPase subunit
MIAGSTKEMQAPARQVATQHIELKDVSVRYTLLTEDQKTLKGRVLNLFNGAPPSAHFWALRNVGLKIRAGEIVGVVGRNGSGKSTLLRVISGVIEPVQGTISISGRLLPILELGAAFNPELTGRENIYLNCSILGIPREQVDEMIPQILAFSEIGMFLDVPLKTYSSGMAARLAFSLSTQIQPEIVILDEVLGVGDESFQKKSFFRIRKLIESGVIVVLVSHSAAMIEQLCNRVVYLSKGEVVADGPPRQVLSQYHRDASSGF